jgi:ribosomal protein L36
MRFRIEGVPVLLPSVAGLGNGKRSPTNLSQIVHRKGRMYVICKSKPRHKQRQG